MGLADWIVAVAGVVSIPTVTYLIHRSTKRTTSESDRLTRVEKQVLLQSNYIHDLRGELVKAGITPPAWPEGMWQ